MRCRLVPAKTAPMPFRAYAAFVPSNFHPIHITPVFLGIRLHSLPTPFTSLELQRYSLNFAYYLFILSTMVAITDYNDPVATAHRLLVENPGAEPAKVLSSLPHPSLDSIPLITDPSVRPGQWVRYVGLLQDIWDTELFVASSPDGKSGLLVENAAASNSPEAKLAERLPIYLVSLPGETAWVRELRNKPQQQPQQPSSNGASSTSRKRTRDDVDADDQPMQDTPVVIPIPTPAAPAQPSAQPTADKRHRSEAESSAPMPPAIGLNTPVHNQPAASAIVAKLYDNTVARDLRINTVLDVVGILQEPLHFSPDPNDPHCFASELAARNPNNVQRLHVVSCRKLSPQQIHPLTAKISPADIPAAKNEVVQLAPAIRQLIIRYLASSLFGDLLAAEYLLMCLLSRPSRVAGSTVLGKLSLNLVLPNSATPEQAAAIIDAISHICAAVVEINVSIAGLNSVDMFPKKDYTLNRLKAAPLQLAPGTCLIGNETKLSDGRLAERGVRNVRALTNVSQRCITPIDFEYYQSELGVDCCSVFLSKGGKSIVPTDVVVRVQEDRNLQLQCWRSYDVDIVRKIRLALALLAEDGKFDITEEATKAVEGAYVEARRNGKALDGQECLQKWLAVARCSARSFGEAALAESRWKYALDLESQRSQRTPVTKK